ncbi:hypothetical protein M8J77_021051 [Diaphorina citri]|nr:hypothetical protein M8J77_021051 [Diaphorina citri]
MADSDMIKIMMANLKDIKDTYKTTAEKVNNIDENIGFQMKHLASKSARNEKLLNRLMERMNYYESDQNRNLLIFNVVEKKNESIAALQKVVMDIFCQTMQCNVKEQDVERVKRIGKRQEGRSRPIVVSLHTVSKKNYILSNARNLKGSKLGLDQDFPKSVVEARKKLKPIMMRLRQERKYAVLKYDQLYVDGILYDVEEAETLCQSQRSPTQGNKSPITGRKNGNHTSQNKNKKMRL